jgi:MFS transporter, DHA1 family, tetracycline resistance protein
MKKSPLMIVFMTVLLNLIGFGMVIPLLPFYAMSYGADGFIVGSLTATFSLSQLIFTPVLGAWSDRIGRRPTILLGLAVNGLAFTITGIGGALWVLFIARAVNGFGSSSLGAANAYIADVTTPENRSKGLGMLGAAYGIGFVIGPAIGGVLGGINQSLPFFVAAVLATTNFVLGWFLLPESLSAELRQVARQTRQINTPVRVLQSVWRALQRAELRLPILVFFFFNVSFTAFEVIMPLFAQHRYGFNSQQYGFLFAYMGVLVIIMQGGLVGLVVKKLGDHKTLRIGMAILVITMLLIPIGDWLPLVFIILFPLAVGQGIATPTSAAIISISSRAEEQGEILGISQGAGSLARMLGPLAGGFIFSTWGDTWPFIGCSLVMVGALSLALRLRIPGKEPEMIETVNTSLA